MKKLWIVCILLSLQTACQGGESGGASEPQTNTMPAISEPTNVPTAKESKQGTTSSQDEAARDGTVQAIPDQSFDAEFESWGKVKFESAKWTRANGQTELLLRLIDANGQILYTFPASGIAPERGLLAVNAVSFKDVDEDGKKDVIVIADYSSPIDQSGKERVTFPTVYIQADKDFLSPVEILGKEKTISGVLPILKQEETQNIFTKEKVNDSLCKRVRASELSEDEVVKIYTDEYEKRHLGGGELGEDLMYQDIGSCFIQDTHERLATNSELQSHADTLYKTVNDIAGNLTTVGYIRNGGGTMWGHLSRRTHGINGYRINHYMKIELNHPEPNPNRYKELEQKLSAAVTTMKDKEPKDDLWFSGEALGKAKEQYKEAISKFERNIQALKHWTSDQDEASIYLLRKVTDMVTNFETL